MKPRFFRDRREAGRLLAEKLANYANRPDVLVLALPRGGVPVAYEVARALNAPLDVFIVRKLGVPGYEELAMGAIATGGVRVLNYALVGGLQIPDHIVDEVAGWEQHELMRRERLYRGDRPPPEVRGRTIKIGFYGLDLYSLRASMEAVLHYLERIDPETAKQARDRYACFDQFGQDPQAYGYLTGLGLAKSCEDQVIRELVELQRRAIDYARRDGRVAEDEFFEAVQNARVVKNAAAYYRSMFLGAVSSWNHAARIRIGFLTPEENHGISSVRPDPCSGSSDRPRNLVYR
jgi:hypothetical protein